MKTSMALAVALAIFACPLQAGDLKDELMAREHAGWTAWGKRDGAAGVAGMTDDMVQVVAGVGRVTGKQAIATATSTHDCTMKSFEFKDPQLRQLTPDVVILHFRATQDTSCGGTALPATVDATSVYVRRDGNWMTTSYQETPVD